MSNTLSKINAMYDLIHANNWGPYIGAEETGDNGVYVWTDGSPWDYTAASNDGLHSTETRIAAWTDGKWHDWGQGESVLHCMCRRH